MYKLQWSKKLIAFSLIPEHATETVSIVLCQAGTLTDEITCKIQVVIKCQLRETEEC